MRLINADDVIDVLDMLKEKNDNDGYWEQLKGIVNGVRTLDEADIVNSYCSKRNLMVINAEDYNYLIGKIKDKVRKLGEMVNGW